MMSTILSFAVNLIFYSIATWFIYLILDKKYLKRIDELDDNISKLNAQESILILALINKSAIKIELTDDGKRKFSFLGGNIKINETHIIGDKSLFDGDK